MFQKIAECMSGCHEKYEIKKQVRNGGCVTDNARNFTRVRN